MIAFLRGRVLDKHPNKILVDVNGVGYELNVPLSTYYDVGEPGAEISLRVHTHVREDALFERLIGVSGIGPRVALAVLSGIEPAELIRAIERGDIARLTAIPGVGKKTSERIVLELKDRLGDVMPADASAGVRQPTGDRLRDDLVSALENLGYHRPLAERAADAARARDGAAVFEDALKSALRELMR